MFTTNEIFNLEKTLLKNVSSDTFQIINTECFGIKKGINFLSIEMKENKNNKLLTFFVGIETNKKTLLAYICKHNKKTILESERTLILYDFFKLKYR
jgi:hypothetical protein